MKIKPIQIVIETLISRDGNHCQICKQPFSNINPPEVDHIIAKANGGLEGIENFQLLHGICNKRKGARSNYAHKITRFDRKYDIMKLNEIKPLLTATNNFSYVADVLGTTRRKLKYLLEKYNLSQNTETWDLNEVQS